MAKAHPTALMSQVFHHHHLVVVVVVVEEERASLQPVSPRAVLDFHQIWSPAGERDQ